MASKRTTRERDSKATTRKRAMPLKSSGSWSKKDTGTPERDDTFVRTLNADERVRRIRKQIKQLYSTISIDDLSNEMTSLHTARLVRSITTSNIFGDQGRKLTEAGIQNQSFRSRVVEIKMKLMRASARAAEALESARSYIHFNYPDLMASAGRTQAERAAALDAFFKTEYRLTSDCDNLILIADTLIDDLDQAAWSLKRIVDMMAIQHSRQER